MSMSQTPNRLSLRRRSSTNISFNLVPLTSADIPKQRSPPLLASNPSLSTSLPTSPPRPPAGDTSFSSRRGSLQVQVVAPETTHIRKASVATAAPPSPRDSESGVVTALETAAETNNNAARRSPSFVGRDDARNTTYPYAPQYNPPPYSSLLASRDVSPHAALNNYNRALRSHHHQQQQQQTDGFKHMHPPSYPSESNNYGEEGFFGLAQKCSSGSSGNVVGNFSSGGYGNSKHDNLGHAAESDGQLSSGRSAIIPVVQVPRTAVRSTVGGPSPLAPQPSMTSPSPRPLSHPNGVTSSGEVSAKNSFQNLLQKSSSSSSRSQAPLSKVNSDSGVLFQTFSSAADAVKGYSSPKTEGKYRGGGGLDAEEGGKHSPLRPVGSDSRLHYAVSSALCSAYQSPQNHQLASVSDSGGSGFFTLSYVNGVRIGSGESGGKNANNVAKDTAAAWSRTNGVAAAGGSGQPVSGPIRTDSGKYTSSNGRDDLSIHGLAGEPQSLLMSKSALSRANNGERKHCGEMDSARSRHNNENEEDDEAALLEATRLKMTIPVLRRHLVESLKTNTRAVRKLNAQTQQATVAQMPVSQQPLENPLAQASLGDSVRRRSLKLSAVSFSGRDEELVFHSNAVVQGLSASQLRRHQSLSPGPRQRRGTVEAALLGLAGAGEDTASRRRSSSQSASSQTATNQQNRGASPTRSSYDDCGHQQQLHKKSVVKKERPEGPIHDPSDATDPAFITKRAPEWMIDDEDPSSLPAMQRYLSVKSRQRREQITNKDGRSRNHTNNNTYNEGGEGDRAPNETAESPSSYSRASPLSSSREVGVRGAGVVVGEDSSLFGSAQRSNLFASQRGGGEASSRDTTGTAHPTREFFYRVGNETKSGIVPANSKLGLDHNTLAKMVGSPCGNATSGHNATATVLLSGASASVMRKGRGLNNNSASNGAASSLMVEGGGAAFISSVAFHSPYVQGVLAPLLKQTREREKILENTSAAYGKGVDVEKELETSTVRRWSLSALRASGRGQGGGASSPPGSPLAVLSALATNPATPQAAELAAVLMNSSQRGGGANSRDFGGDRDPITPAPLSNQQMADIYSTSSRRDLLRRAAVEGPAHRLSREDKLVATVLLEEMDRKKKELLDALDDDLGDDAHQSPSPSAKKITPAASFVLGGSKVDPKASSSSQQSPISYSLRRSVSPTSWQDSVVHPPRGPNNRRGSVSPPAAEGSSSPIGVKRELSTLSAASNRSTSAVTKLISGGKAMRTTSLREEGQIVSHSTPQHHQAKGTGRIVTIDTDELNQLSRPLLSRFKEKVTPPMLESYNILVETEKQQPWLIEPVPKKASSSDPSSSSASTASSFPRGHPSLVRSRAQALLLGPETLLSFYDTTATATRHLVEHRAAQRAAMANASGPSGSYLLSGEAEARHRTKMLEPTRHGGLNVFVSNPLAGMDLSAPSLLAATQERCEDAVARKRLALVLKILEDEEDVGRRKIILAAAEEARKSAEVLDVEFEQENRWRRPYVPRQRF